MPQNTQKPIAHSDGIRTEEKLPYRFVLYPGFYGAFFAFRKTNRSPIVLCSCSRVAVENYVELRLSEKRGEYSNRERMYVLDSMYFPRRLVRNLMTKAVPSDRNVLNNLKYKDCLCHECNQIIPQYRYCHEMYGGTFKQTFGWYIIKQGFEFGIEPINNRILKSICPEEILDLISFDPEKIFKQYETIKHKDIEAANNLYKSYQKQIRRIWRAVENEVRQKFGFKKIGDAWTNETILYNIICNLLPKEKILRHNRPKFLEGLEFDIYIPKLKLGIEYQGIQHFKPVRHWGGKEALSRTKKRDRKKAKICKALGINLVYFKYDEHLGYKLAMERLARFLR